MKSTPETNTPSPRTYVSDIGRGWRLVARSTANNETWSVSRIMVISDAKERLGMPESSGNATATSDAANAFRDDDSMWSGHRDERGRFHIGATSIKEAPIDRIILTQGDTDWAASIDIESLGDNGQWGTFARVESLQPGTNELYVSRPSSVSDRGARVTRKIDDPFADRRILVAIAAYRDPDIAATISNAITQAAYPEHLRFAICHQFDRENVDALNPWIDDPRFSIQAIPHDESAGVCWARARTFEHFDDEPYLLQISQCTRFAARWDQRYIGMLESVNVPLPVITAYPPGFTVDGHGQPVFDLDSGLGRPVVRELRDDLTTLQETERVANPWEPGPSASIAASQIFTRGRFCTDVPYDPEVHASGEEVSLAARAVTSGYDLLFPTENLIWHGYDQRPHEQDHAPATSDATDRLKTLFFGNGATLGRFGLGTARSLSEFEQMAGVRFASVAAAHGLADLTIDIDRSILEPRDDYEAFVVILLDDEGNEVERRSVRDPLVLDLDRATITLRGIDANRATRYLVAPTTHGSYLGEVKLRRL